MRQAPTFLPTCSICRQQIAFAHNIAGLVRARDLGPPTTTQWPPRRATRPLVVGGESGARRPDYLRYRQIFDDLPILLGLADMILRASSRHTCIQ